MTWVVAALVLLGCAGAGALTGLVPATTLRRMLLGVLAVIAFVLFAPTVCVISQPGSVAAGIEPVGRCESAVGLRIPEFGTSRGEAGHGWAFVAAAVTVVAGTSAARRSAAD